MTAAIPPGFMPYGAPELRLAARPNMARALMLSSVIGGVAFALSWLLILTLPTAVTLESRDPIIDLIPLPPPVVPAFEVPEIPVVRPTSPDAIPVPVPEPQTAPESAPITQGEAGPSDRQPLDPGGGATTRPPTPTGIINLRGEAALVDELPEPVLMAKAVYPELAKQAGIEGRVVVDVLVGKDGRVLDALVNPKHSIPILDQAAVDAVRQWVFKPALMNNHPVKVWVTIPFHFKLH